MRRRPDRGPGRCLDDVGMNEPTAPAAAEPGSGAGPVRFARMTGSSIAGRDAAPWVTDFLNAAYYRRAGDERDVDDLRLAFAILTTYWYRKRPGAPAARHRPAPPSTARSAPTASTPTRRRAGRSTARSCSRAPRDLIGDWFAEAYADDARRGWGIAFPTVDERDAYDPP